ncbi:hypothetical protein YB2330_000123 [Saitoella coloradoensis]
MVDVQSQVTNPFEAINIAPQSPQVDLNVTPRDIAQKWLHKLSHALEGENPNVNIVDQLWSDKGWMRDLLAFSWDFRTLKGKEKIKEYLAKNLPGKGLRDLAIESGKEPAFVAATPEHQWIQSFFTFETTVGQGRGLFRLIKEGDSWRALTFYTGLEELEGHEEKAGANREQGTAHGENIGRRSWLDRREEEYKFENSDPTVVIIGAGHSGLNLAARLGQLNVPTLIVEKNDRIGDNWRLRYKFLVLHDPVWYDHLSYLPFPKTWPVFTPKDKLGDWFESYAKAMELNVWTQTPFQSAEYDEASKTWTCTVKRPDGSIRTLKPKHVVLATGHSGEANIPKFPGQEKFKGRLVHSSQHTTGKDFTGKKAVVVGCCNSGHDIAHDFYEQGADVTIVQRSSTYVMTSKNGLAELFRGLYDENGPPTEDADIMFSSTPNPLHADLHQHVTRRIADLDKDLLDGLQKAGFKLDFGDDGSGFLMKYFRRGGGYYLDVGASNLIAEGKIKVKQGVEIERFDEKGIIFKDGSRLDADIVVLATGYQNMRTTARRLLGDKVADRCNEVWGMDEEGELKTMWRSSGHPRFYFMGGNLALCRFFSKRLALQIKAQEEGLYEQ